jgi:O-succinylbenzoic acid--CoA ligase
MGSSQSGIVAGIPCRSMSSLRPVRGTAAEITALLRGWDCADDPAPPLVVQTSGSTGRPKRVVLSRGAMRASADATHARLGGPGQWLLALPPSYVAGLQVLFRSVRAGTEPAVSDDVPGGVGAMTGRRRYVSLVPTQLRRMLHADPGSRGAAAGDALAGFDAVLVGGASLDPRLRDEAEAAGLAVVATYGMSETCGGCVYDGVPLDGVEVRTVDGLIQIRGPVLFDGYEDDPPLTAGVLREGWFVTPDLGRIDDSGRLHVDGRADDVVVSGGVNVPSGAVAARLRTHPGVRAAEVVGAPDDEWGRLVVAVAVTDAALPELRDHVAQAYPRAFAPRRLVRVDGLPLLPNGKVDRLAVERLARG